MKINVNLYGTFDSKGKCHAEIVECDYCEKCSLYKVGKCLNVSRPLFCSKCKFGEIHKVQGYTRKAAKYYEFCHQYRSDAVYNKLKYPDTWRVAIVDDIVLLNLVYVIVSNHIYYDNAWHDTDKYTATLAGLFNTSGISYIPISELTSEIINNICARTPTSLSGGAIEHYQDKIVPNFLYELKNKLPEIYNKAIEDYPDLAKYQPNFVGQCAYIYSLRDDIELKDTNGVFIKKGNKLISDNYHSVFLPFNCNGTRTELDITDDMYIQITDNSMVDENTVFK